MSAPCALPLKGVQLWVVASGQGTKVVPLEKSRTISVASSTGKLQPGRSKGKRKGKVNSKSVAAGPGAAVKDLHAESLCRRGFVRFIYDCIRQHVSSVGDGEGGVKDTGGDHCGNQVSPTALTLPRIFKSGDDAASADVASLEACAATRLELRDGVQFHM
jgi:hypothetical protein